MIEPAAAPVSTTSLEYLVHGIAALLRHGRALTLGDVAALRRMDPRRPAAAFFKIEGLILDGHLPGDAAQREDQETRWATVVLGLAHLGDLHRESRPLGIALAAGGFSEIRFARLLQADSEQLVDELPSLARFLAAKGEPANWTAAARLILSAGRADEESTRRHLARDYYGAMAQEDAGQIADGQRR